MAAQQKTAGRGRGPLNFGFSDPWISISEFRAGP